MIKLEKADLSESSDISHLALGTDYSFKYADIAFYLVPTYEVTIFNLVCLLL